MQAILAREEEKKYNLINDDYKIKTINISTENIACGV